MAVSRHPHLCSAEHCGFRRGDERPRLALAADSSVHGSRPGGSVETYVRVRRGRMRPDESPGSYRGLMRILLGSHSSFPHRTPPAAARWQPISPFPIASVQTDEKRQRTLLDETRPEVLQPYQKNLWIDGLTVRHHSASHEYTGGKSGRIADSGIALPVSPRTRLAASLLT